MLDKKRAAMDVFGRTQRKAGEDYSEKLDRFFAGVDGGMGYMLGMGYVERFSRLNPEKLKYLPLSE